MKTTTVRARVTLDLKHNVEGILSHLGLTTSRAIELFFHQIQLNNGIPFALKIPNEISQQTFNDTDENRELIRCNDAVEMFNKLDI